MNTPKIVVLIDEATRLFGQTAEQKKAFEGITQLLQRGPAVGIHLIMTTDEPQSERLSNTLRLNLPVRLVGKVADEGQAMAATDMSGTQAEYLLGQGDFLAVVDGQATHFQAAFIGDYDLHLTLETLHRARPQPLLAHPVSVQRVALTAVDKPVMITRPFMMMDSGVEIFDLGNEMDDDLEGG
jgi:DNA segregation ATPase FtsK/SpoIIIE-like protein